MDGWCRKFKTGCCSVTAPVKQKELGCVTPAFLGEPVAYQYWVPSLTELILGECTFYFNNWFQ